MMAKSRALTRRGGVAAEAVVAVLSKARNKNEMKFLRSIDLDSYVGDLSRATPFIDERNKYSHVAKPR
jgi:hypothetical protein